MKFVPCINVDVRKRIFEVQMVYTSTSRVSEVEFSTADNSKRWIFENHIIRSVKHTSHYHIQDQNSQNPHYNFNT